MSTDTNKRELEATIERNLSGRTTYASYLHLDTLLSAQRPVSKCHDEMLFIVQHHVAELWLKLMIHELSAAVADLNADDGDPAQKKLARVKRIQDQLFNEWVTLETLTPRDYLSFREYLGPSSGFQSLQYRTVEFMLGNKNSDMLAVFKYDPAARAKLQKIMEAPTLYDAVLRWMARRGHGVDRGILDRDVSHGWVRQPSLVPVFARIYENPRKYWAEYEICETLVDIEESFQLWRFRHMKAVERIIGYRRGTGGSTGVGFLRKALDLTFFPELLDVRTELKAPAAGAST